MTATVSSVDLDVSPLSRTIGAEIHGLDLRHPLGDDVVTAVRAVLVERKVVFFRGQHLTPAQHVAFAEQFGETTSAHPVVPGLPEQPQVFEIDYSLTDRLAQTYGDIADRSKGLDWHTDVTFVERPPLGSILNAVAIPDSGGDTMWSDQQAAYEGLSPAMQEFLTTLTARHDGRRQFGKLLELYEQGEWDGEPFTALDPTDHPVVRTHPESGRRTLFVNGGFTTRINELTRAESDDLLRFLCGHSVKPEYTVRFHWRQGDVGFWDNRQTQHAVVGDYDAHRVIQRVTLRGDRPVLRRS